MRKALVIGINAYGTASLSGCINDASAFASIIETHSDGSPNFGVKLKTDIPTKSELKTLISELFQGKNDVALFYFSGHGYINELGGYIVTPDYSQYDEGISMDEILTWTNNSTSKNKIIILDCCFSGTFGTPSLNPDKVAHISEGVSILTASRDSESAIEINGHGVFTNLLLDALRGGAADLRGHVTPGSIYAYIDQSLGPWDQRPVFKTNVTRFTSLRTVTPPIPLEILRKLSEYFEVPESEFDLNPSFEYTEQTRNPNNVQIFKNLQKLERVGLVVPVDEEHMYYAAINSKTCKLTALGHHYWRLVKDKRI
jgi:hypothetical protein